MTATPAEITTSTLAEEQAGTAPAVGDAWTGFRGGHWRGTIDVRDFIQSNYTPYEGDASFLSGPTERTTRVWDRLLAMFPEEIERGIHDVDVSTPSRIDAFAPGYIDPDLDLIVGLQTDAPLKRAIMPNGGWRMVEGALKAYGYEPDPAVREIYTKLRKTHNDGVFDAYTPEIRACRSSGIITGLPDAYGRGRIIGDYRRVALYGVDRLIAAKKAVMVLLGAEPLTAQLIQEREETSEQIRALEELRSMALSYGYDVSGPARTSREAVQWTYFAYLGAVKEQNGAAMSIGRIDAFLDIYLQRDIERGLLTESQAQELIDDFVIKLRIVRFLRTPEYNELYSGDPTWVTWSMAGLGEDGRPLVTRTTFRALNTLYNLGPAPEPNLTVFWSPRLPEAFKAFASQVAVDTSALQFESDDLMRPKYGDDTAIACCVSAMAMGRQMQFFGARVNVAKALLYAINGGRDEFSGKHVVEGFAPITDEHLDYDTVLTAYDAMLGWLAKTYVHALNIIHYMHDKYAYERLEMALHDREILRTMACGIAGLSVAADSLSAIKHARVKVIRDNSGLAVDYVIEGDYPAYGNNDDRADDLARWIVHEFMEKIRRHPTYRDVRVGARSHRRTGEHRRRRRVRRRTRPRLSRRRAALPQAGPGQVAGPRHAVHPRRNSQPYGRRDRPGSQRLHRPRPPRGVSRPPRRRSRTVPLSVRPALGASSMPGRLGRAVPLRHEHRPRIRAARPEARAGLRRSDGPAVLGRHRPRMGRPHGR